MASNNGQARTFACDRVDPPMGPVFRNHEIADRDVHFSLRATSLALRLHRRPERGLILFDELRTRRGIPLPKTILRGDPGSRVWVK